MPKTTVPSHSDASEDAGQDAAAATPSHASDTLATDTESAEPAQAAVARETDIDDFFGVSDADTARDGSGPSARANGGMACGQAGHPWPDPANLLAELALARALGRPALTRMRRGRNELVIIQVPNAGWLAPVGAVIHRDVQNASVVRLQTERQRGRDNATAEVSLCLLRGRFVAALTTRLDAVPVALASAADHVVRLALPDAGLMTRAIRVLTRRRSGFRIAAADIAGLGLSDFVAAMRPGSSPAVIAGRLRRATARLARGDDRHGAPDLATLAGYGAAKDWALGLVADIGRFLANELDGNELESAILAGPPGTGKTEFVRAVARAARVPLIETSVGEWMNGSSYLDQVLAKQNAFFDSVLAKAPCVGFVDELDALPGRGQVTSRNADYWNVVSANQLLRCAELRSSGKGAVLLAATNYLDRIDPALRRPGRFDRIFTIARPDATALMAILRQHLGTELPGADLSEVARLGEGGTGADALGWIRIARQVARRADRPLRLDDLLKVVRPMDDRPDEFVRAVALHEAGHCIAAFRLGIAIERVSVAPRGVAAGWTQLGVVHDVPTRARIEAEVIEILGGRAADIVLGSGPQAGASHDLHMATVRLTAFHTTQGLGEALIYRGTPEGAPNLGALEPRLVQCVEEHLQRLMAASLALITANRGAVAALAETLVRRRVMTGAEVAGIAAAHPGRGDTPMRPRRPAAGQSIRSA